MTESAITFFYWSGQSYNIKLIATVSAIDSTASDVVEMV